MTNYDTLIRELADAEVRHARIQMLLMNKREKKAIDTLAWRMIDRIELDALEQGQFAPLYNLPGPRLLKDIALAAGRRIMNP